MNINLTRLNCIDTRMNEDVECQQCRMEGDRSIHPRVDRAALVGHLLFESLKHRENFEASLLHYTVTADPPAKD